MLICTGGSAEGKGTGSSQCWDQLVSPYPGGGTGAALLWSASSSADLILGEGGLKCTQLHPTRAGGKWHKVWLWGAA